MATAAVAAVAHYWVGMSWPTAFVLGAIVSPPDAVAAMAVTQRLRVPKIVTTILEGESLVNDASALVILRLATAAVVAGSDNLDAEDFLLHLTDEGARAVFEAQGFTILR